MGPVGPIRRAWPADSPRTGASAPPTVVPCAARAAPRDAARGHSVAILGTWETWRNNLYGCTVVIADFQSVNCPFFYCNGGQQCPCWRSERPDARDWGVRGDTVVRCKAARNVLGISKMEGPLGHVRRHTYSVQPTSIIQVKSVAPDGFMHAKTEYRNEPFNDNDS